ncbi:MAG: M48 family metalloprotease [bacterium]
MKRSGRASALQAGWLLLALAAAAGCAEVAQMGTAIGQASGALTTEQAQSINRTAVAMDKTFKDITPEQEYYIGRAVAASVLDKYRPMEGESANRYINVLGQALAQASDRPETFGGYHFQVLASEEINAFAAPGGLIMVSRGLLRCCKSEDAVAAVLAHEIGHVQGAHGLRAIRTGRLTSALTILAAESAKNLGNEQLAELTRTFEGSISDITSTLMNSGYSRNLEREADASAVTILKRVGYNPHALLDMLGEMKRNLKPGGPDFAKTHPDPEDRMADVRLLIGAASASPAPAARQQRFEKALSRL